MCSVLPLKQENKVPYDAFLISWEQRTIVLNSTCRTPALFRRRESESKEKAAPNVFITHRSRVYTEAKKSERLGVKQQLSDE